MNASRQRLAASIVERFTINSDPVNITYEGPYAYRNAELFRFAIYAAKRKYKKPPDFSTEIIAISSTMAVLKIYKPVLNMKVAL